MPNLLTQMIDRAGHALGGWLSAYLPGVSELMTPKEDMAYRYAKLRNYYNGDHDPQLKSKMGATNDNVMQNFIGLAVDRSVSRLYRGGITFKPPKGATKQEEYLKKVWDLNKKEILLYQLGLHGSVYGTPYLKICPEELKDLYEDSKDLYPRLVPVDPEIMRIKPDPSDVDKVWAYINHYNIGNNSYWEITIRNDLDYGWDSNNNFLAQPKKATENNPEGETESPSQWHVDEWQQINGGPRELIDSTEWPYDFPPIIHWKNLPSLRSCYGDSDIDDSINVQDKSNFIVSNTGKIIKFHASPKTVVTGVSVDDLSGLEGAPEGVWGFPGKEAKAANLQMDSDLTASREFATDLRQSIMSTSREIDISSMADKIGALTNFGLQVLWSDAIDKNDTKRQLYGDAIKELNRRILVLANFTGPKSNPGDIQWGNPLPMDTVAELTADEKAMNIGIVDKETVANRYKSRYGVEYADIKAKIDKEQDEAAEQDANIGKTILRNFNKGGGVKNAASRTAPAKQTR